MKKLLLVFLLPVVALLVSCTQTVAPTRAITKAKENVATTKAATTKAKENITTTKEAPKCEHVGDFMCLECGETFVTDDQVKKYL